MDKEKIFECNEKNFSFGKTDAIKPKEINNQLDEIRKIRHLDFMRKKWLPYFLEKYKDFLHPKRLAAIKIQRFIRKHILKPVINISEEQLNNIPGVYRLRLKLTEKNRIKPTNQTNEDNSKIKLFHQNGLFKNDPEIYKAIKIPFHDSITFNNIRFIVDDIGKDDEINKIIRMIDEYEIQQELQNSLEEYHQMEEKQLKNTILESLKQYDQNKENEDGFFYVCIDLRIYGPNPYQPIYIIDIPYYLNNQQIEYVQKIWRKIDPNTPTGIRFHQNLEFQKSLIKDNKTKLFQ